MAEREFKPGFRFDLIDAVVLVAGFVSVVYAYINAAALIALVISFVVFHFFLFCNVFRISRPPEMIWATWFVLCCVITVQFEWPGWVATAIGSVCLSVALIVLEMRKPSYHGVMWKRLNPSLPEWWQARQVPRPRYLSLGPLYRFGARQAAYHPW